MSTIEIAPFINRIIGFIEVDHSEIKCLNEDKIKDGVCDYSKTNYKIFLGDHQDITQAGDAIIEESVVADLRTSMLPEPPGGELKYRRHRFAITEEMSDKIKEANGVTIFLSITGMGGDNKEYNSQITQPYYLPYEFLYEKPRIEIPTIFTARFIMMDETEKEYVPIDLKPIYFDVVNNQMFGNFDSEEIETGDGIIFGKNIAGTITYFEDFEFTVKNTSYEQPGQFKTFNVATIDTANSEIVDNLEDIEKLEMLITVGKEDDDLTLEIDLTPEIDENGDEIPLTNEILNERIVEELNKVTNFKATLEDELITFCGYGDEEKTNISISFVVTPVVVPQPPEGDDGDGEEGLETRELSSNYGYVIRTADEGFTLDLISEKTDEEIEIFMNTLKMHASKDELVTKVWKTIYITA